MWEVKLYQLDRIGPSSMRRTGFGTKLLETGCTLSLPMLDRMRGAGQVWEYSHLDSERSPQCNCKLLRGSNQLLNFPVLGAEQWTNSLLLQGYWGFVGVSPSSLHVLFGFQEGLLSDDPV